MNKKIVSFSLSAVALASGMLLQVPTAYSMDLISAYGLAKANDPKYRSAQEQQTADKANSVASRLAYLPTATWSRSQPTTIANTQTVTAVQQPIFDASRGATVAQGFAQDRLADASFTNQVTDLAQRTLTAVQQVVVAYETVKTNESTISALESQYAGAKRKYELGQGTVTDTLDVQVKFEQAKATHLNLKANLKAALDQFQALTGEKITPDTFRLPSSHESVALDPLDNVVARTENQNPTILSARASEDIARYDIAKSAGSILPTVSYTWQNIHSATVTSHNSGVTMTIPISLGNYVTTYATAAKARQSFENRILTEVQTRTQVQNLHAIVEAGFESLKIKRQAVDTAELSLTANRKSYDAGIKSTTDVLISIQNLAQAKTDYVQSATQQAANYLSLLLVSAEDPDAAIQKTQAFLFRK